MRLEHALRYVQPDRASLRHGRLLWWSLDTATLAPRCRRGASTPSTPRRAVVTGGGRKPPFRFRSLRGSRGLGRERDRRGGERVVRPCPVSAAAAARKCCTTWPLGD